MGSMITLGIENMEIDWGKNNVFIDHSPLFQLSDIKQIPYYYVDYDTDKLVVEMKEGYAKKLSDVKQRLDLLGYTISNISIKYNALVEESLYHDSAVIDFNKFYNAIYSINLNNVDLRRDSNGYVGFQEGCNGYDFGEYARKCVLHDPEIKNKLSLENEWDVSYFLENIEVYIILRILAENPVNENFELQWRIADVIEGGWVKPDDIVRPLSPEQKILVVTEGSSDSFIIRKTIDSLYSCVADFFDFIDMESNYPFTGVGNLYNFCQGLAKIQILNRVLIVFDNDTAGVEKYKLAQKLKKPKNLHVCILPNCDEFENFDTVGPEGNNKSNINGKAVSVECFLDFKDTSPYIRWTAYNKNMAQYQGEICPKDDLVRVFKSCDLNNDNYNNQKLKYLVDYLTKQMVDEFFG